MGKRWQLTWQNNQPCGQTEADFVASLGLHPVAALLLANRKIRQLDEIERFLEPSWELGIHDPQLFSHMPQVVERIFKALEAGEKITVHGDYDADGVTGSAVMISTLKEISQLLGERNQKELSIVESYIPHRDKEGYGLNPATIDQLHENGTALLITVDCGIASVAEVAKARALGMDVIVVDHHQFGDELPDALCIHPRLPGENYPFKDLAAVGVAWKVACALLTEARKRGLPIPEGHEKWLLDLVAIATITDMVPLLGENRVLETFGLKVLNKTRRAGLQALAKISSYKDSKLDATSVAFGLGPRINAAGRMDHASLALRLMLAETPEQAEELAAQLEEQNRERQKVMAHMMEEAETQLAAASVSPLLAFWSEAWPPALVGLVAGRFLDRTGKPCIAIGRHGGRWVGSGRSTSPFDITAALRKAGEGILSHVGGHMQACGFSFPCDIEVSTLLQRLAVTAEQELKGVELMPTIGIDAELKLQDINWNLVETLVKFEPYGEGNRRPVFMVRNAEIAACDLVGQSQNHLRCLLRDDMGNSFRFIGFNFGNRAGEFGIKSRIDVAFEVDVNEWNGRRDIQCKMVDVREETSDK